MVLHYRDESVELHHGDCLDVLTTLPDNSVDSICTDPPYGLEFMGAEWDGANGFRRSLNETDAGRDSVFGRTSRTSPEYNVGKSASSHAEARVRRADEMGDENKRRYIAASVNAYEAGRPFQVWCQAWAEECLRVLKPGGHMLAFGGTRTFHRLACAIEDAGFEIRDSLAWLYASGFPKSLDVSRAIDKAAGAEREVIGRHANPAGNKAGGASLNMSVVGMPENADITAPATEAARQWQGWGTALKPSHEPVICARKPFNPVPLDWRLVTAVHHALAGLLWLSLSPAKRAETLSVSSPAGPNELRQCVSALVSAATVTSHAESARTDTFSSPATESTCLSIVSLWSDTLGALSAPTSTYTTSMRSSTTTALKILNSLLAPVISPTTMPACECLTAGQSSYAPNAESNSSAGWANWLHTLSASAAGTVIETTAVAVCNALVSIVDSLSIDQAAASTALPTATTRAELSSGRPSFEPIVVARKPFKGTVAANVQEHGTGALNIDACRIAATDSQLAEKYASVQNAGARENTVYGKDARDRAGAVPHVAGRWPPNAVFDEEQAAELDRQSGVTKGRVGMTQHGSGTNVVYGAFNRSERSVANDGIPDEGGASRFFPVFKYTPKAGSDERPSVEGVAHPTVKPVGLMRWLVKLVTPPHGVVLDPFAGSGTTGEAAIHEHMRAVLIEREASYLPLIVARLSKPMEIGFDFE